MWAATSSKETARVRAASTGAPSATPEYPIGEGSLQATGDGEGGAGSAFDIGLGGGVEFHAKRLADVEGGGADEGHAGLTGARVRRRPRHCGRGKRGRRPSPCASRLPQRQMVAALLVVVRHRPRRQRAVAPCASRTPGRRLLSEHGRSSNRRRHRAPRRRGPRNRPRLLGRW